MSVRLAVVLVTLVGVIPGAVTAQVRGSATAPVFAPPPPSGSPFPANGPAPRTNPSPRLNQVLPDPLASRVPNPIMRPAGPPMRPGRPGMRPIDPGQSGSRDVFRAAPWTYAPRYGRLSALGGSYYGYGGYVDGGYAYGPTVPVETDPLREGRLTLNVSPLSAEVRVDGFYVGTVADFQDRGLWLEPGPRRIDLRADGYEDVTFDVRILEDQTVNYRRDLAREAARVETPRVAAIPKTFYVIPGCYAGDAPPRTARLPKGCLAQNVRTIPPVLNQFPPPARPQPSTKPGRLP
jgi:hypothetical protein